MPLTDSKAETANAAIHCGSDLALQPSVPAELENFKKRLAALKWRTAQIYANILWCNVGDNQARASRARFDPLGNGSKFTTPFRNMKEF